MEILIRCFVPLILAECFLAANSPSVRAQAQDPSPTHHDVAYDDAHAAQKLDVYLAESNSPTPVMVYIHGGGWSGGSKSRVPDWLMNGVRKGWFSVVSVEYRFTDVAPHPAQVNDCMRAVQFIRHNTADWHLDPQRIGVTGGSAGGHLSLWVALHDDAANADSTDPVERKSSRVACAVSFAGPTDWSLLSELEHLHPGYRLLLGYEPDTPTEEIDVQAKTDVSPISFVSQDDPTVMLVHGDLDRVVPVEHSRNMHEKLKSLDVETELIVIEGGNHLSGAGPEVFARAVTFMRKQLRQP
jgi:acetyl esterase/lipase